MRALTLAALLITASAVGAETMSVPEEVQGAIFKKIFNYDKALRDVSQVTVFIVGADKDDPGLLELVKAFRDAGMFPAVAADVDLGGGISPESVVYLLPGADREVVKQHCIKAGVLTISGIPSFAEQGDVSVGLGKKGKGTEIIVNLQRLRAEAHELSADILRLARVIR
jgi:hypothetical protein